MWEFGVPACGYSPVTEHI